MAVHPGQREKRRWANLVLEGRRYSEDTPAELIHDHLRRAPRVTQRNILRSRWAREDHRDCGTCQAILAEPDHLPPHLR